METPKQNGLKKWAVLGAAVVALEISAGETLTAACHRGLENPSTRPFIYGALAITAAHLLDLFEPLGLESYDPYHRLTMLALPNQESS